MREVCFVLTPGFLLLDLAGPAEAFRIANQFGAEFTLRHLGIGDSVTSSLGLPLGGIEPLPETLADGTLLVIPGVTGSAEVYDCDEARRIARWLASHVDPRRHLLATVCSGALLAARAGLLAGRDCTTHHVHLEHLRQFDPSAKVRENRVFVEDGAVFSSAGVTAGIDLALHLIARLATPALARDVARHMVVYFRRSPQDPELSPWLSHRNHLHPAVHRAQDLIAGEPEQPWSVDALAEAVHVSPRHLARLFRQHAGVSVHDYQQQIRLARARQWLAAGLSREKAALSAGFSSARQLGRAERQCTP
ncbi:GlxA family transcriptional regulator [Pseudogulbenkiania sp. MAI-1]|uniref:GlxA family transcriptional regulator n=1 Tax=Pseudogulbenkiania sp. MAI-1 TaxID=990370 RepID=UPI00045E7DFF|nr:helix-turn-helix domain-containing protein [Pseudogulbenkiania sp. MAI-1]